MEELLLLSRNVSAAVRLGLTRESDPGECRSARTPWDHTPGQGRRQARVDRVNITRQADLALLINDLLV